MVARVVDAGVDGSPPGLAVEGVGVVASCEEGVAFGDIFVLEAQVVMVGQVLGVEKLVDGFAGEVASFVEADVIEILDGRVCLVERVGFGDAVEEAVGVPVCGAGEADSEEWTIGRMMAIAFMVFPGIAVPCQTRASPCRSSNPSAQCKKFAITCG